MTGGYEAVAIGLSVLMHVTWNLIARHQPRDSEPLWWVLFGHLVLVAPWGSIASSSKRSGACTSWACC